MGSNNSSQQRSAYNCCYNSSLCCCCHGSQMRIQDTSPLTESNVKRHDYEANSNYDYNMNPNNNQLIISPNNTQFIKPKATKFRAFIIGYHREYGYLLLKAYKKKGSHYQLPGGRIDENEIHDCSLEDAALKAAKRELFEETGIDLRTKQNDVKSKNRLRPLRLGIKNRMYFEIEIKNSDSLHHSIASASSNGDDDSALPSQKNVYKLSDLEPSLNKEQDFYIKLSSEHHAFQFVRDIQKCIKLVKKHSGGHNSHALTIYSEKAKHERRKSNSSNSSSNESNKLKMRKKRDKLKKKKEKKHKLNSNEQN